MLKFKQFSSMHLYSGKKNKSKVEILQESQALLGAICGVLVERSEDGSGFVEKASFGYEEQGFFYSFLASGRGYLEKLQELEEPMIFQKSEFPLFSEISEFAVVAKIKDGLQFIGFIILEFEGSEESRKFQAYLLANFLSLPEKQKVPITTETPHGISGVQWLIENHKNVSKEYQNLKQDKPVLLVGPKGSGKKTLARNLHKTWGRTGQWIWVDTIPEQVGKLEKSLLHWEEILGEEGSIVLGNLTNLSLGQQRIFYEWLQNSALSKNAFFIDNGLPKKEIYPAFWDIISQNALSLPSLEELSGAEKESVIREVFRDLAISLGKSEMEIPNEVWKKLSSKNWAGNFEELKNSLGKAIWKTSSNLLNWEEESEGFEKPAAIGIQDSEDLDLPKCVEALERQKILLAEKIFAGNQLRMAKALKISRGALQYKMKNLGLL
jgi:energy-coupling factor transporter ATP-binding protein EcfA2